MRNKMKIDIYCRICNNPTVLPWRFGHEKPHAQEYQHRWRDNELHRAPIICSVGDASTHDIGDCNRQDVENANDTPPLSTDQLNTQHKADDDDRHRAEADDESKEHVELERLHEADKPSWRS